MLSLPEHTNASEFSINTTQGKRPHQYHSDVKGPKDILTAFQVSAKPQYPMNPYNQYSFPVNNLNNYGGFGVMAPSYPQMPISAINQPVSDNQRDYITKFFCIFRRWK